jgi:hypothetical protein
MPSIFKKDNKIGHHIGRSGRYITQPTGITRWTLFAHSVDLPRPSSCDFFPPHFRTFTDDYTAVMVKSGSTEQWSCV